MLKSSTKKQLINTFVGNHDLVCLCKNPAYHSLYILAEQLGKELNPQDKQQIIKCLGETTTDAEGDIGIDTADLEKLFGEEDDLTGEDAETR